jgi:cellulose biosynthesis protein BcsQ
LDLHQSWVDCLQRKIKGFAVTGALAHLAGNCADEVGADFIFYDVGPNIGPLNRAILLDCDYFIVPAACDYFSTRALKTLGHSVASWIRDWQVISTLSPKGVSLFRGRPRFLGYVLQRFRMYGGELASSHKEYARQLERQAYSDVVTVLREVDEDLAPGSVSQFKLGQIKDFSSLATLAQEQGLAFADVEHGTPYLKEEAKTAFHEFAQKVLARISET